jgi:predicted O-methyltransferase YrrM
MTSILSKYQDEYLNSFRKETDDLISSMEKYAEEKKIPILHWQAAEFIEQLILIKNPFRVLELGTAIAYTTIRIAKILSSDSKIISIEKSKPNIKIAKQNIDNSGVANKIELIEGEANSVLSKLDQKYEIIFLDADKEDYIELFQLSLPLLKEKGIIIVDNLLWHGYTASKDVPEKYKSSTEHIREFNKVFFSEKQLNTNIYAIGDGLGVGIKKAATITQQQNKNY